MSDAPVSDQPQEHTLTVDELAAIMIETVPETPLHKFLGLRMHEATPKGVVISMPVAESAFNSTGNLHGGSLATLVDVTCGTAAVLGSRFRPGQETMVTADLHIRYLGRPNGDTVVASARVRKAGRQLIVVECEVRDPQDRTIVIADFASMIVPLREPLRLSESARANHPDL